MQISVEDKGETARVGLNGKLDSEGARAVETTLAALAEKKNGIVVDLSALTFLASAGIRQLVSAAKIVTRRGGRMVLFNPSKAVHEILTISAIDSLIPIARTEKDAQAVLAAALGE
jgi:anti-sigma B factor antagonist